MTSKQILSFKKNPNLCETSTEYPSLGRSLAPRHLCTCVKPKISETIHVEKLSNKEDVSQHHDQHEQNSKENSKNAREQTELIKLFQYKQQDELNDKLYKKYRYPLRRAKGNDDDEEKDNTN
ncbi:unnamed protein product [Rotaria sordida]|uniref:Uncharacterized protein n=1 Tax=Rotaria sordida TaxID=392033 RepID=A0A819PGU4_9BILA|nr:unnamed protein product [Rotaria sordida]CAF4012709.1 unnamed protein product [Rotaria sordida]